MDSRFVLSVTAILFALFCLTAAADNDTTVAAETTQSTKPSTIGFTGGITTDTNPPEGTTNNQTDPLDANKQSGGGNTGSFNVPSFFAVMTAVCGVLYTIMIHC